MDYPSACPLQVGLNCPLYPLAGPMWSVMLQDPWVSPPPPSKFSMLPPGSWAGKNRSQPLCWINQIEDAPLCIPQCPRLHPKCSLPSPGNDLGVGARQVEPVQRNHTLCNVKNRIAGGQGQFEAQERENCQGPCTGQRGSGRAACAGCGSQGPYGIPGWLWGPMAAQAPSQLIPHLLWASPATGAGLANVCVLRVETTAALRGPFPQQIISITFEDTFGCAWFWETVSSKVAAVSHWGYAQRTDAYCFSHASLLVTQLSNLLEAYMRGLSPPRTSLAHQGCWSCMALAPVFGRLSPAELRSHSRHKTLNKFQSERHSSSGAGQRGAGGVGTKSWQQA